MRRGENKCGRCGKEAAQLSACGGFYDLVPTAAPVTPVASPAQPAAEKGKSPLVPVLAVICAVLAVLLVVLLLSNSNLKKELADLEEELDDCNSTVEGTGNVELPEDPTGDGTTDPSRTEESILGKETVTVCVNLEGEKAVFQSCEQLVVSTMEGQEKSVFLSRPSVPDDVTLGLTFTREAEMLVIDWSMDLDVLGELEGESQFVLRSMSTMDENGETVQLLEDKGLLSFGKDEEIVVSTTDTPIRLEWAKVRELLTKKDLPADSTVMCEFVRTNTEGGCLVIVVSGIVAPAAE
jgi:hypothetical protein